MTQKKTQNFYSEDKASMLVNLGLANSMVKGLWTDFLQPYGISTQQHNILRVLRTAGDWKTMHDVKALMIEESPNATRLADKLMDKDLIKRKRSAEDRRVVYIKITANGLKVLKEIDRKNKGAHIDFAKRISDKDARTVSQILNKLMR